LGGFSTGGSSFAFGFLESSALVLPQAVEKLPSLGFNFKLSTLRRNNRGFTRASTTFFSFWWSKGLQHPFLILRLKGTHVILYRNADLFIVVGQGPFTAYVSYLANS